MSRMLHNGSLQQQRDTTEWEALHAQDWSQIIGLNNSVKR